MDNRNIYFGLAIPLLIISIASASCTPSVGPTSSVGGPAAGSPSPPTVLPQPTTAVLPTSTGTTGESIPAPRHTATLTASIDIPGAGFSYVPASQLDRKETQYSVTFTSHDGDIILVLVGWQDARTEIRNDAEAVSHAVPYLPKGLVITGVANLGDDVIGGQWGTALAISAEIDGAKYQGALTYLNPIPGQSFIEVLIAPPDRFQREGMDYLKHFGDTTSFLPPPKLPPDPRLHIATLPPPDNLHPEPTPPSPLHDRTQLAGLVFDVAKEDMSTGTWTIAEDGTPHKLSELCGLDISPGSRLALESTCEEDRIVDLKTQVHVRTVDIGDLASWSTDSRYIFFTRDRDIWQYDIRSGNSRNLTNTPERTEYIARPWPGHKDTLILFSWPSYMDEGIGEGWVGYLTSLKIETGDYTLISQDPLSQFPAISPLGQSIIYNDLLYRYPTGSQPFPYHNYGLGDPLLAALTSPEWSPNGRYLAGWYTNSDPRSPYSSGYVVVDWELGFSTLYPDLQPMLSPGWPEYPEWSPDSSELLLTAAMAQTSQSSLWAIDAANASIRAVIPLASPDYVYCSATWSPDSLHAAILCSAPTIEERVLILNVQSLALSDPELPPSSTVLQWRSSFP